jgi:hypothetical protein
MIASLKLSLAKQRSEKFALTFTVFSSWKSQIFLQDTRTDNVGFKVIAVVGISIVGCVL